jgi:AAA domain
MALECADLHFPLVVRTCENIFAAPEHFAAYVAVSLIVLAIRPVREWLGKWARAFWNYITSGWSAARRLAVARDSVSTNSTGPWLAIKPQAPSQYTLRMQSAVGTFPVVVSANLKGGVGKTTITANIAASFAKNKFKQNPKPVLAIDLDYQGSLSSLMFAGVPWRPSDSDLSPASHSVAGHPKQDWLVVSSRPATWVENPDSEEPKVRQIPRLEGISAFYDLAETEDRLRLLWAIAEEKRDIRYFLYELLHNDALRNKFSMVLIDAPPRLTTSCIQALVASTHYTDTNNPRRSFRRRSRLLWEATDSIRVALASPAGLGHSRKHG